MSKVSRNIFTLIGSRFIASFLVFIGYASLFRYLGTYVSGQHQFVLSFVMLFSVVVDFGIQQLVIKQVSEDNSQAKKYLGNFFAVEFVLALCLWVAMIAIAFAANYEPGVRNAIILAGLGMFLTALTIPHTSILSAHQDMGKIAAVNFMDSLINVGVMFAAILTKHHVVFLVFVQVLNGLSHLIIYNHLVKRYVPKPELFSYLKNLDWKLVQTMIITALPFGALIGFSIMSNKIDVILLQYLRGYNETGLYTAAYKFVDFLSFLPAIVSSALYPFYSAEIKAGNMQAVKDSLQNYTRLMLAAAVPIAVGGAILSKQLIVVVGGSQFQQGYGALQILVFASAILFSYAAVNSLMINQLTALAVKITFVNIFINIIGNLIFIPRFGFKAAAMMTVVSELTQAVLYFYFVQKKIAVFKVFSHFPKPILASGVMAGALWSIQTKSLFITIPVGIVIYFLAMAVLGFFKQNDLMAIKRLAKRNS
ncbi:MAG: lipopolysaccharide biosynthesis protein [Candidatus Doudnabacteria bacterium]